MYDVGNLDLLVYVSFGSKWFRENSQMVEIVYGKFIQVKSDAEKHFECYSFSKICCYSNVLASVNVFILDSSNTHICKRRMNKAEFMWFKDSCTTG